MVKAKKIAHKEAVSICYHFPHIDYGYRANHSFWDTVSSLFSFHNETMNIWSHLLGFLCIVVVGVQFIQESFETDVSFSEYLTLQTYIICAAICLFLSTLYHWFGCLSEQCHDNLLKLDLTGVAILVAGSFLPGVYFGFYCVPGTQTMHLIVSGLVLLVGLSAPWIDYEIKGVQIRPFVFAALVVFGLFPCLHWTAITPSVYYDQLNMGFIGLFLFYGAGFGFYVSRYPEKAFPKSYIATHILPSHTLWHVCVLGAIFVWYFHINKYQKLLKEIGCTPYGGVCTAT